jgi:hypothetical protein
MNYVLFAVETRLTNLEWWTVHALVVFGFATIIYALYRIHCWANIAKHQFEQGIRRDEKQDEMLNTLGSYHDTIGTLIDVMQQRPCIMHKELHDEPITLTEKDIKHD